MLNRYLPGFDSRLSQLGGRSIERVVAQNAGPMRDHAGARQRGDNRQMPAMTTVEAIRVQDNWVDLEDTSPVYAVATVRRSGGAFVGEVEYRAGLYSGEELSVTRTLSIPLPIVESFLETLSQSPITVGPYELPPTYTDYSPERRIALKLAGGSIDFSSKSQNEDGTPWLFTTTLLQGQCHVDCFIETAEPFIALTSLNPYLERAAQQELFRLIQERDEP